MRREYRRRDAPSSCAKGRAGEDRACAYLERQGFSIIERNFRTRGGEIDAVAEQDGVLVFVETKYLPGGSVELLAHELGPAKQQKILKTAKCYLQKHREYKGKVVRFDVLAIDVPGLEPVHHIVNAFTE